MFPSVLYFLFQNFIIKTVINKSKFKYCHFDSKKSHFYLNTLDNEQNPRTISNFLTGQNHHC